VLKPNPANTATNKVLHFSFDKISRHGTRRQLCRWYVAALQQGFHSFVDKKLQECQLKTFLGHQSLPTFKYADKQQ